MAEHKVVTYEEWLYARKERSTSRFCDQSRNGLLGALTV